MAAGKKKPKEKNADTPGSERSLRDGAEEQLARTPRASKKSSLNLKGQTEKALKERIKELDCFFGISAVMELQNITLDEILEKIVLLPPPPGSFPRLPKPVLYWKERPSKRHTSRKPPGCSPVILW